MGGWTGVCRFTLPNAPADCGASGDCIPEWRCRVFPCGRYRVSLRIGESVYVGNVEYLVHNFVEDRIVVSTINKMDVWVYNEVKQEDVWLPVDAMAPANG